MKVMKFILDRSTAVITTTFIKDFKGTIDPKTALMTTGIKVPKRNAMLKALRIEGHYRAKQIR